MRSFLLFLFFTAFWPGTAVAESNWPQWRGPLANGVSPDADPPVTWSETSHVKWKVRIPGRGTSTPIIWEDKIFLTTAIPTGKKAGVVKAEPPPPPPPPPPAPPGGNESSGRGRPGGGMRNETPSEVHQFALLCLERSTGKVRWQRIAKELLPHEGHHRDHGFASASPVTDGRHVWAFFGSRGLHCFDMDGNPVWSKDLGRMKTRNAFGEGSSPLLTGDTLVINWDHEGDDFIAAFDKKSGDERWRQKRDEPTTWSTPLAVPHDGGTQVVVSARNRIRSYDLASGRRLWECGGMTENVIPSPLAANGIVYALSGFRGNAIRAIKLGHTGDLTDTDAILWKYDAKAPYVPSGLLYGDRLYFFSQNTGLLSCLDARTGQPLIDAERLSLSGVYASPIGAAGRVYLIGRNGEGIVIKDADKLEVLATNKLDEKIDASPAAAGKELFLRGHESLYCLSGE